MLWKHNIKKNASSNLNSNHSTLNSKLQQCVTPGATKAGKVLMIGKNELNTAIESFDASSIRKKMWKIFSMN